jgi:HK97 family phage prohead protease
MSKEIRSGEPVEIRAEGDTISVSGYAAVFNSETIIGGKYREQIAPGAFTNAIGRDDVMFLINHDGLPMARTKSGTLTLAEDERGLYMSAELDSSDPDVRAIVPKMKRGDLDKMSFAFSPEVQSWDDSGDMPLRTIRQASLYDVSIVTYPAYQDTDIGLRSLSEFRSAQETKEIESNPEAIAARLRMKLALS